MPDSAFDSWLDEQIARLRLAVTPTFKAVYQERESNRAALKEKDAALVQQANIIGGLNIEILQLKTALAVKGAEIARLQKALDECHNPSPQPTPYVANRIQIVWATGTDQQFVENAIGTRDLRYVWAVIVTADIKAFAWGRALIARLRAAGCQVWAYMRAPIHMRIGKQGDYTATINSSVPFESAVYNLVKAKDAWVWDAATGKPLLVQGGFDVYITPWLIAKEHAALVRQLAWDASLFHGLLVDALPTNRIYAGGGADFDNNRVADVVEYGWFDVSIRQRAALELWLSELDGIPVCANDAWEPATLSPYASSPWRDKIIGCMDEDGSLPFYEGGNDFQQKPTMSQRWEMHRQCAADWVAVGRHYFMGGDYEHFAIPREQNLRLLIASALLVGGRVVANEDHAWFRTALGKPTGVAVQQPDGTWQRPYQGGIVKVNPATKTGEIVIS